MKRIYLSGAHAVGKSTLARYIANKYRLELLPEAARIVLSEMELSIDILRSDIDILNKYQEAVFNKQLALEANKIKFISDRSLIDAISYSIMHSTISQKLLDDERTTKYINNLKDSIIFFVRPSRATLKDDGTREFPHWDGVIAIDSIIKTLFEINNIKYYPINTDSIQERVRIIDQVLSN